MTVSDVLEQAKQLNAQERQELLLELIALQTNEIHPKSQLKTGSELVALLLSMDPIELVDPEIEDPTEWVIYT